MQNNLLIDMAATHTVLYFTAYNQDSQSESRNYSAWLGVMEIVPGQNFLFGAAESAEEDYGFK